MGTRIRLMVPAVAAVAALAVVVGGSVAAASPTAPGTWSTASGTVKPADKKDGQATDAAAEKVAKRLHVTVQQLVTAMDHLKKAVARGTGIAKAEAAFAKELHISLAQAKRALRELSGDGKGPGKKPGQGEPGVVPAEAVKALAATLHVSESRARQVFRDLDKVRSHDSETIVDDPSFIAIAKGLGVSPQQLVKALTAAKQAVIGKPGKKDSSSSSGK